MTSLRLFQASLQKRWTSEECKRVRGICQDSKEWRDLHTYTKENQCGIITMGSLAAIMGHGRFGASAKTVLRRIVHGETLEDNPAMAFGRKAEPITRKAYETYIKKEDPEAKVETCGLWVSESDPRFGASPDGIVTLRDGSRGLLEIKALFRPKADVDYETLALPDAHRDQIQGSMGLLGLQWCDYVMYIVSDLDTIQNRLVVKRYAFDKEYYEKRLYPCMDRFYNEVLLPNLWMKSRNLLEDGVVKLDGLMGKKRRSTGVSDTEEMPTSPDQSQK